ncbi:MAG: SH3 domain-containing protein [Clostridiales bacterium]|nr:SH3 domain-containing protein [Clostridiales bacterium]
MKRNDKRPRIAAAVCAALLLLTLSGCQQNINDPDNQPVTPNTGSSQSGGEDTGGSTSGSETTAPTAAITTASTTASPVQGRGYCNSDDGLRIRSGPGTDYRGIGGLKYGEEVTILGREGDWYKIVFKDTGGYVSAQFIQATPPSAIPIVTTTTAPAATTTAAGDNA